jgi:hypothetical protein
MLKESKEKLNTTEVSLSKNFLIDSLKLADSDKKN